MSMDRIEMFQLALKRCRELKKEYPPTPEDPTFQLIEKQLTYLVVVFLLFPLMIWTGLAMSPAITSVFPSVVTVFGGQQSARTIHFFVTNFLVLFLLVHIAMLCITGFRTRMRAMITGHGSGKRSSHE